MWVIIPIKSFGRSKQRLSAVLSAEERKHLAKAMASDVVQVATQTAGVNGVLIVSDDPEVKQLAAEHHTAYLNEAEFPQSLTVSNLNHAVNAGRHWLRKKGIHQFMVIPSDLPLLTPQCLSDMIDAHNKYPSPCVSVTPDWQGQGTNLLMVNQVPDFMFQFGEFSCERHMCEAIRLNAHTVRQPNAEFAFDVDLPRHITELCNNNMLLRSSHTQLFFRHRNTPHYREIHHG